MCGIVGFISQIAFSEEIKNSIYPMLKAISHRGPDDEGVWFDSNSNIILAHRRLSVIDLSKAGHQPMQSYCGRWVITFNGEIYNHESLKKDLAGAGFNKNFRGHSDTEVFLASISIFGIKKTLEKSVGMFSFALWDKSEKKLFLVRDRLGEKPLYYGYAGNHFVFASELGSLYKHPLWRGEINRDSLALLMRHNCIPAPYSIFSNISKLQPGKILTFEIKTKKIDISSYWSAAEITAKAQKNQFSGSANDAVDELEKLIKQSLSGQMLADVPLGVFLSGGIDSSTIVALMQSMSKKPIQTFSIGFKQKDFNEANHAKEVAHYLKTEHTELYITPKQALNVIPKIPLIYSEPFSDSSQIPTFLVSELAKKSVTVSLSGDGGDELFSGYSRYTLSDRYYEKLFRIPITIRKLTASSIENMSSNSLNKIASLFLKLAPAKYRVKNPADKLNKISQLLTINSKEDAYYRLISHWKNPAELVLNSNEPKTMLTGLEIIPNFTNFISWMMYLDMVSYLPDDILTKVDRASMAVSLETRIPLLDYRIVEFAKSLPIKILRREGQSKWPLRQVLYRYVPKSLVERPKMGFGIPIDDWLKNPLRDWAESLLNESRLKSEGYFNAELVRKVWHQYQSGKQNFQYQLWNVLMFQSWLEHYKNSINK